MQNKSGKGPNTVKRLHGLFNIFFPKEKTLFSFQVFSLIFFCLKLFPLHDYRVFYCTTSRYQLVRHSPVETYNSLNFQPTFFTLLQNSYGLYIYLSYTPYTLCHNILQHVFILYYIKALWIIIRTLIIIVNLLDYTIAFTTNVVL